MPRRAVSAGVVGRHNHQYGDRHAPVTHPQQIVVVRRQHLHAFLQNAVRVRRLDGTPDVVLELPRQRELFRSGRRFESVRRHVSTIT